MRSEFEKWYRDKYQVTKQLYFFEDTQRYEDGFAQDAWEVWQHQQSKVDELQSMFVEQARTASNQQAEIDELQKRVDAVKWLAQTLWEKSEEKHQQGKVWESKTLGECADEILDVLEQALKGGMESKPSDKNKPA